MKWTNILSQRRIYVSLVFTTLMTVLTLSAHAEGCLSNIAGVTIIKATGSSYYMAALGIQFQEFGGGDRKINDMFVENGIVSMTGGTGVNDSDSIQIWDADLQKYDKYYFGNDGHWYHSETDYEPTVDALPLGSFVWYSLKAQSGRYIVLSGEVRTEDFTFSLPRTGGAQYAVAYPFPSPFSLMDITDGGTIDWVNSSLIGAPWCSAADHIQWWVNHWQGYNTYFFWDDVVPEENWNRKWCTLSENWPTVPIPVVAGFWLTLKASISDFSITFPAIIK